MAQEPLPPDRETRRAAIAHDLNARLAPVCADWPPELFAEMIDRLADISLKYEGRATSTSYDRRTTDRLIAEMQQALERSRAARDEKSGSHD